MKRATTPTHSFDLGTSATYLDKILITYVQRGQIVLEKHKEDLSISDKVVSFTLTQEEANLFKSGNSVNIQVRMKTSQGKVFASDIITMSVDNVLNDEVL